METNDKALQILVYLNAGTLAAIIGFGYKVIRFFNGIEFKTDLMWEDYKTRKNHERRFEVNDSD
jgi:hypothetical protein